MFANGPHLRSERVTAIKDAMKEHLDIYNQVFGSIKKGYTTEWN